MQNYCEDEHIEYNLLKVEWHNAKSNDSNNVNVW